MLKLKEDQSLMVSLRHLSHLLDGKVNQLRVFMEEHYSDNANQDNRYKEVISSVSAELDAINDLKSKLKTLGNAGSLDEMSILLTLNDMNEEYTAIIRNLNTNVRSILLEEEKEQFDTALKIMLLFSFVESIKYSNELRNNKVNDLLEVDSLSQWGSVFRISEWTNANVFTQSESQLHRLLDAIKLVPSISKEEAKNKFVEQSRHQIGDELLGSMITILRSRCEQNESLQLAEQQAQAVVLKTLNYLSNSKLPNFFEENI